MKVILVLLALFLSVSVSADELQKAKDKGLITHYLIYECKGEFETKEKFLVFQELRRRGEVPEFSLERCLEWGIIPPWTKEEEGEG